MVNASADQDTMANTANTKVSFLILTHYTDQMSSKMFYYFIVFVILIAVIAGLFFFSYNIWLKMRKNASKPHGDSDEIEPITGVHSGIPKKSSQYARQE